MRLVNFENFGFFFITLTLLAVQRKFTALGSVADNDNNPTICKKHYRHTVSRYVSYSDIQYPFHRVRWNYRLQTTVEISLIDVCCDGYEPLPNADTLVCFPICKSGCANGKCLKPEKCTCNPGYKEWTNKSSGIITCEPNCPSGCLGGNCISPGTCTCNDGYILTKDADNCKPSCSSINAGGFDDCGPNASCIEANVCKCDDGYTTSINSSSSSSSSSSGIETTNHQDPQIPSRSDWSKLEKKPKPTFNTSDIICEPHCEPECGQNSTCVAPNDCQCSPGYKASSMTQNETSNNNHCLPVCEKDCVNGFCGFPNKCICHFGFKPDLRGTDDSTCEPICKNDCVNGICTFPDHCECNDGYEKLSIRAGLHENELDHVCVPVCPGQCLNGCCISPGYCLCNPGYVINIVYPNETARMNFADGIDNNDSISLQVQQSCQPLCHPGCPIGSICTAPNQCQLENNRHQDLDDFSRNDTEDTNFREFCGKNGVFMEKNDSCRCYYGWMGSKCTEPSMCAVVIGNDDESDENIILQSVIVQNNGSVKMNDDVNREENNGNPNWRNFRCEEECRILVLSSKNLSNDIINCHRVGFSNATMDFGTFTGTDNETAICFMKIGSSCNTKKSKIIAGKIFVGYFFLFALVIGVGSVSIYFIHRKIVRMRAIRAVQRINAMRELAEATESLYATDDSSHI